ncbi:MAG TPA: hypothetical protein DCZ95_04925 [Verrucomicrobia bacterium]|nr:MAG: hypothetical protein A2X46_14805 [Lentisphaerae bacterium GWF2_57_35]HBA83420.1 hypothetical protein [Verrucomicrobiota bacterium]
MEEKAKLIFIDGGQILSEVPLDAGEWTLGRSRSCTIQIEDNEASSRHAVVRVTDAEVWLKDTGSKNGTYLNEKLLRGEVSLAPGDIVRIGKIQFRFEAPVPAIASAPTPSPEDESAGSETRFMAVPEEHGTRMLESEKLGAATGSDDGTVALPENATRMLEASELKGLQAGPKPTRGFPKVAAGIVLSLAVLGIAIFIAKQSQSSGERAAAFEVFRDQNGGFEFSLPENWSRSGKPGENLVSFKVQSAEGARAQLEVIQEVKADYEQTGLTQGFQQFLGECKIRHPEFVVLGQKKMELNEVMLIFYGFSSKEQQGKGIYLLDGDRRLIVEGYSSRRDYPVYADLFSTILQSFRLYQDQKYFDFPAPDEAVRRISLASPEQAAQKAREHFQRGKELLLKRDVRLDNLYRAIIEFQTSLQFAVSLTSRPSVYGEAASELKYALQLFNETVRRQRFEINRAYKQGDWQTAYWAASELMQRIPDKTDPLYQEAGAWVKKMTKKKKH